MAVRNGTSQDDFIDMTNLIPGQYETGNRSNAGSGNDTVYGSSYNDIIEGGDGNDLIYGWYGDDALIGDNGNVLCMVTMAMTYFTEELGAIP